ncbi:alpha beta hydrolase fold-3 domain containing protein [Diplodia corticola]|uniref:Alpha beta hydrolase fold-3 domain containing protein n=1 Tax=Diplodia corticola TaxID=236234 RepID=A0A1J9SAQ1_9PEZI|nr:alpha beta hydrolase fold-3 domain containing protein [Diplodia corticola]OJD36661.1 alpha beta hydrolase fold-3 domain containing protein [Diplodia corticola]
MTTIPPAAAAAATPNPKILTRQPLKAIYILTSLIFETLIRLPLCALLYCLLPSLTRPDPRWTWRQAIGVRLLRAIVQHSAAVEGVSRVPLSLAPGAEGERFEVMEPAEASAYRGPLQDDDDDGDQTRPARIGGTWYAERYCGDEGEEGEEKKSNNTKAIVLHLHGGAFVLGDGRENDCGALARTMLRQCHSSISHVFCPQYRLAGASSSSSPGGDARYPAALQDALTAYLHLRRRHRIPASRIVLSGDSAGGNIVNALLRYIATYRDDGIDGLEEDEAPACAWLWSPWTSPAQALDAGRVALSPNRDSDYVPEAFGAWGCRAYAGHRDGLVNDSWISVVAADAFPSPAPVWVQTGGRELLFHDNVEFFEGLRKVNEGKGKGGQPCELEIVPHAPHDIALLGHILGFSKEYEGALEKAEAFFQRVRK